MYQVMAKKVGLLSTSSTCHVECRMIEAAKNARRHKLLASAILAPLLVISSSALANADVGAATKNDEGFDEAYWREFLSTPFEAAANDVELTNERKAADEDQRELAYGNSYLGDFCYHSGFLQVDYVGVEKCIRRGQGLCKDGWEFGIYRKGESYFVQLRKENDRGSPVYVKYTNATELCIGEKPGNVAYMWIKFDHGTHYLLGRDVGSKTQLPRLKIRAQEGKCRGDNKNTRRTLGKCDNEVIVKYRDGAGNNDCLWEVLFDGGANTCKGSGWVFIQRPQPTASTTNKALMSRAGGAGGASNGDDIIVDSFITDENILEQGEGEPTHLPSRLPVSVVPTSTPTISLESVSLSTKNAPTDILAVMAEPRPNSDPCKVSAAIGCMVSHNEKLIDCQNFRKSSQDVIEIQWTYSIINKCSFPVRARRAMIMKCHKCPTLTSTNGPNSCESDTNFFKEAEDKQDVIIDGDDVFQLTEYDTVDLTNMCNLSPTIRSFSRFIAMRISADENESAELTSSEVTAANSLGPVCRMTGPGPFPGSLSCETEKMWKDSPQETDDGSL